jgi:hypothetical protein
MARFKFDVCLVAQIDDLVKYIHENWSENHIFCNSRDFLDWQHKSKCGTYYNFIVARNTKNKDICGVLGFIPTSHFSNGLEHHKEVWPVLWKVSEGPKYVGLGTALLNFLIREFAFKSICSISISKISRPIYQKLGYTIGRFTQLAIINSNIDNYCIAAIDNNFKIPDLIVDRYYDLRIIKKMEMISELSDPNLYGRTTIKDVDYFVNRYLMHPVFNYRFLGVYREKKLCAFLVTRVVKQNQRSVIRVVDIQGDITSITKITKLLHDILVKENHEYIDIMQFGLPEKEFIKSGFVKAGDSQNLVIPDYFEPFVKSNIDIFFARKSENIENDIILFKGDGDQDRPNSV